MTIAGLKTDFEKELKGLYSSIEIKNIFYYVLSHLLEVSKLTILSHTDKEIDENLLKNIGPIVLKLKKMMPVQYVLGKADFYDMVLDVNPSVLIPRPETEELADWIIKENMGKNVSILDVCTGSGCIALALKKNLLHSHLKAIDFSAKALEVAKANAKKYKLNIDFMEADALKLDQFLGPNEFDIIVSNPPYVTPDEKETMHDNVMLYEPHEALFVPGNDPLIFYKAIAEFAKESKKTTMLYFEINESKGDELTVLFKNMGLTDIIVKKDINGKDRMLKCTYLC